MVRLVDDLLDVSRISRGKIELRKERVELASVVRHAVEASRPLIESTEPRADGRRCRRSRSTWTPTRRGWPRWSATCSNNACKYTDAGGRISLDGRRARGANVGRARVRDTGIGIAADQLPRIFEMFTQVDTLAGAFAGRLGIGLTLVKSLVEMHGGTVEAHSAGRAAGSEFVVRLPRLGAAPIARRQSRRSRAAAAIAVRRILVVDDNRDAATAWPCCSS